MQCELECGTLGDGCAKPSLSPCHQTWHPPVRLYPEFIKAQVTESRGVMGHATACLHNGWRQNTRGSPSTACHDDGAQADMMDGEKTRVGHSSRACPPKQCGTGNYKAGILHAR